METKTIEVCDAIMVDVTCAHNDYKDIKSGGPATLGYEFYVNPDEDKVEYVMRVIAELSFVYPKDTPDIQKMN